MSWRVEWSFATRDIGGQCVILNGIYAMQKLCANSLVSTQNVNHYTEHPMQSCRYMSTIRDYYVTCRCSTNQL